jgi:excisionase family DNA binding protein
VPNQPSRPHDCAAAAEVLGTNERHVRILVARGDLAHVRVGRLIRILPEQLEDYLDKHTVSAQ